MRPSFVLRGFLGILAVMTGFAACSHPDNNPEDFCAGIVRSTCQGIQDCCQGGSQFDFDGCMVGLSQTCQSLTAVTDVESSLTNFDSGAAAACFGSIKSCDDYKAASTAKNTYAHTQACANMLTGPRPVGAACSKSDQCARAGDYSTCYDPGTGANTTGICVQVVLDQTSCSFSFSTLELHVCPDGNYCDIQPATGTSTAPPTQQAYEFSASCKPYINAGGSCVDSKGKNLPCADGNYCTFSGANMGTCTAYKTSGQTCDVGDQCAAGLNCKSSGTSGMSTCQEDQNPGTFCYVPPKCGDGICQTGETMASCPSDCGCAPSCLDAIESAGVPCANDASATSAYNSLKSCASNSCSNECPMLDISDFTCQQCLQTNCTSQTTTCESN